MTTEHHTTKEPTERITSLPYISSSIDNKVKLTFEVSIRDEEMSYLTILFDIFLSEINEFFFVTAVLFKNIQLYVEQLTLHTDDLRF